MIIVSGGNKNYPVVFPKVESNSFCRYDDLEYISNFMVPIDEYTLNIPGNG